MNGDVCNLWQFYLTTTNMIRWDVLRQACEASMGVVTSAFLRGGGAEFICSFIGISKSRLFKSLLQNQISQISFFISVCFCVFLF